jgi:hypothetical protein
MKTRAAIFAIIGILICVALVLIAPVLVGSRPLPPLPLPSPNGYDDFVRGGQNVTRDNIAGDTYAATNESRLRALVASNAESLRLVRVGLVRECCVPLEYSTNFLGPLMSRLSSFKSLAGALKAEGRVAELDGHTNDAAGIYLETIQFGHESARGGLVINYLVGLSCQRIGATALLRISNDLDARTCRSAIERLNELEQKRETVPEMMGQEKDWSGRTFGVWARLQSVIAARSLNPFKTISDSVQKKTQAAQGQIRRITIYLAARAYTLDKGAAPDSVADLVPGYLKTLPQDPFTGTNMPLHPQSIRLGSAGASGSDTPGSEY